MAQIHPENEFPRKEVVVWFPATFSVVWILRVQGMECPDLEDSTMHATVEFIGHN